MALITKATNCGFDGHSVQKGVVISGILAGEALSKLDSVYIKGADGKAYKTITSASAVDGSSAYMGFVFADTASGQPCDIVKHATASYSTGLTPGALFYVSGSAAILSDADLSGSTVVENPIAQAITSTEIYIM